MALSVIYWKAQGFSLLKCIIIIQPFPVVDVESTLNSHSNKNIEHVATLNYYIALLVICWEIQGFILLKCIIIIQLFSVVVHVKSTLNFKNN